MSNRPRKRKPRPEPSIEEEMQARRWMHHAERDVLPMVEGSAMTISIHPDKPDAKSAVELGFTLLLDKPLLILAVPGRTVPMRLRRAADLVIEGDPSDPEVQQQIRDFLYALPEVSDADDDA